MTSQGHLPSARPAAEEIAALTSLRGIAALWVMALHFKDALPKLPADGALLRWLEAGYHGVPLFFLLSGFVLAARYGAPMAGFSWAASRRFWWLRFGRVVPLHAAALVFLLANHAAMRLALGARAKFPERSPEGFLANLLLVHNWGPEYVLSWNSPSWSLSTEAFSYLLFPFLVPALARLPRAAALVAFAGCLAATAVAFAPGADGAAAFSTWRFGPLLATLPAFAAGCLLWPAFRGTAAPRGLGFASLALLAGWLLAPLVATGWAQGAAMAAFAYALLACLAWAGHAAGGFWAWRPLVWLGAISYSIYMTHMPVALAFGQALKLLRATVPDSAWVRTLHFLAMAAAVLVVSTATHRWIEQPCRKWFRRRLDGARAKTAEVPARAGTIAGAAPEPPGTP